MLFEVYARGNNLEESNYHERVEQAFSSVVRIYSRALIKLSVVIECQTIEGATGHQCRAAVDMFGRPSLLVEANGKDADDAIDDAAKKLLAAIALIFEKT